MRPGGNGHAIFLNGIPSAGKSSVAAKIRSRTSTFRVLTGDDVIRQVPFQQRAGQADKLFVMVLTSIERWLGSSNVIVDGAWTERKVSEARERFGHMGLYVVLRIDESERKRREALRKDRQLGHRWKPAWHDMPGPDDIYDVVIDSKATNVSKCATTILTAAGEHWNDLLL